MRACWPEDQAESNQNHLAVKQNHTRTTTNVKRGRSQTVTTCCTTDPSLSANLNARAQNFEFAHVSCLSSLPTRSFHRLKQVTDAAKEEDEEDEDDEEDEEDEADEEEVKKKMKKMMKKKIMKKKMKKKKTKKKKKKTRRRRRRR